MKIDDLYSWYVTNTYIFLLSSLSKLITPGYECQCSMLISNTPLLSLTEAVSQQTSGSSKYCEVRSNWGIEETIEFLSCLKNIKSLNMKVDECFRGLSVLLFITFVGRADSKQVKKICIGDPLWWIFVYLSL